MLGNFFIIFFYYLIGWVGSYLLFITVLYALTTVYVFENLKDGYDPNNKWLHFVARAYDWFGIDFIEDDVENSYIPVKAMFVLAALACLGPYMLIGSLVIGFATYISISLWINSKTK